ncbi:MAG: hypothetical protein JSU72_12430 [Deltaproteobacteria bacterium]|nr:MAG: hypothetical protein JSU72_12430 [Deltaproteobacteria bacterium]
MRLRLFIFLLTFLAAAVFLDRSRADNWGARRDRVVIKVIQLDYADAEHLASVIAPLLSPQGRVVAYARTNALIIKDKASIVKRLVEIIKGPCDQQQKRQNPDICEEDR